MSGRSATINLMFEVGVRDDGKVKMKHYRATNHHRAVERAEKNGWTVVYVRKANEDKLLDNVLNLKLLEQGEPMSALEIEEIAFRKRVKRIEQKSIDKESVMW